MPRPVAFAAMSASIFITDKRDRVGEAARIGGPERFVG
jgi:hypothetical protein